MQLETTIRDYLEGRQGDSCGFGVCALAMGCGEGGKNGNKGPREELCAMAELEVKPCMLLPLQ